MPDLNGHGVCHHSHILTPYCDSLHVSCIQKISDSTISWHGVGHSDYLKCKQDLILCPIRSAIEDVTLSFRLQWYIDFGCF